MPIVTNGLTAYWNGKDGISGGVLKNLAPGAAARNMSVVGGLLQSNGAIRLDAVDDYVAASFTGAPYTTYGSAFTLEFLYTPRTFGTGQHEVADGGFYWMKTGSDRLYIEALDSGSGTSANEFTIPGLALTNPLHITMVYNGATNYTMYVNGALNASWNIPWTTAFSAQGYTEFSMFRGLYSPKGGADLFFVRVYTRALSASEVTQNYNNGSEIGLTVPMTKLGEMRFGGGVYIPVYSITDHQTQALRVRINGLTAFILLVPVTDPTASKIRTKVPSGIMALKL